MSFLLPSEEIDSSAREGLSFDLDTATLVGVFSDELSAYRARNRWRDTLHGFFLLDEERDYEFKVESVLDQLRFTVSCTFHSACGRYAYWRLINQQAPEVEARLAGGIPIFRPKMKPKKRETEETQLPWVLTGHPDLDSPERRRGTLFQGLMRLFR